MADEDLFLASDGAEKNYLFFRAYCKRRATPEPTHGLGEDEAGADVLAVVERMERLIGEYAETAKRVDTSLDAPLLCGVVNALQRESFGEPYSLEAPPGANATKQFPAKSIYGVLLEIPVLLSGSKNINSTSILSVDE